MDTVPSKLGSTVPNVVSTETEKLAWAMPSALNSFKRSTSSDLAALSRTLQYVHDHVTKGWPASY